MTKKFQLNRLGHEPLELDCKTLKEARAILREEVAAAMAACKRRYKRATKTCYCADNYGVFIGQNYWTHLSISVV